MAVEQFLISPLFSELPAGLLRYASLCALGTGAKTRGYCLCEGALQGDRGNLIISSGLKSCLLAYGRTSPFGDVLMTHKNTAL